MNSIRNLLIGALFFTLLVTGCQSQTVNKPVTTSPRATESAEGEHQTVAKLFVQAFVDDDFESMMQMSLSDAMQQALSPEKLASIKTQIVQSHGNPKQINGFKTVEQGGYQTIAVNVKHTKDNLNYVVVFDGDSKIAGFNFQADQADENAPSNHEGDGESVAFGKAPFIISGTLSIPKGQGPFKAAVLVHGSGANDRDETIFANKPFRDIANGLVEQGIAVLRYDKRSFTYKDDVVKRAQADEFTIYDETIDDAAYAVEFLRDKTNIDERGIFVIGHSLGANQAPRIAEQTDSVAGLVMMAGNVSPLQYVLVDQYGYLIKLDGNVSSEEEKVYQRAVGFRDVVSSPNFNRQTVLDPELAMGVGYNYWKDIVSYNPALIAENLDVPMLILQGERDYQVTLDEFTKWQETLGEKALYKRYPKLNHLFIAGEGEPNPSEYQQAGHVEQQVIDDIATFIKNH